MLAAPPSATARNVNVYVTNLGSSNVFAIDTATNTTVNGALISVPGSVPGASGMAITPDGRRAYVTHGFWPTAVSVIDTAANAVVGPDIPVGDVPAAVAVTPDGLRAYVANIGSNDVSVIETPTDTVARAIAGVPSATDIAITPDGRRAYVTTAFAGQGVKVIDTTANEVVDTIPLSGLIPFTFGIAVTPDGRHLYVSVGMGPGTVYAIDAATHQVTGATNVGFNPRFLAITPDGGSVYVPNEATNDVSVIDTATNTVKTTIGGLSVPEAVGITPDGRTAYVANYCLASDPTCTRPSTVTAIDTATNKVVATVPVGTQPARIAAPPAQGPTASLSAQAGAAGSPTTFDASASYDPDGTVARYEWDFGDGGTEITTTPTTTHAYSAAGAYTATVTVADDEGCSADFVFTGRTAYCNGSSLARASAQVTVSGACAASLATPAVSVSHWQTIGTRLRGRLKAYPGGYYLRSSDRSLLALQVRGIRGQRQRALKRVSFYLDGERVASDRKSPYMVSVDPSSLATGYHDFKATVYSRQGKKHDLSLRFLASNCEDAAFSVSMSSKLKRAHPNLELRARSGGAALESVTFTLPNGMTIRTGALQGKRIGEIKLRRESGTKSGETLRFKGRSGGAAELAAGSDVSARLNFKGKEPTLSVAGLKSQDVTAVGVEIYGKRTRMLNNPNSCKAKLKFEADLESTDGNSVTLARSLQMCKRG